MPPPPPHVCVFPRSTAHVQVMSNPLYWNNGPSSHLIYPSPFTRSPSAIQEAWDFAPRPPMVITSVSTVHVVTTRPILTVFCYHPSISQENKIQNFISSTNVIRWNVSTGLNILARTKRALKLCISAICNKTWTVYSIARHCMEATSPSPLRFAAIEHAHIYPRGRYITSRLQQRDPFWQYSFDTVDSKGLNADFSVSSFV